MDQIWKKKNILSKSFQFLFIGVSKEEGTVTPWDTQPWGTQTFVIHISQNFWDEWILIREIVTSCYTVFLRIMHSICNSKILRDFGPQKKCILRLYCMLACRYFIFKLHILWIRHTFTFLDSELAFRFLNEFSITTVKS